MSDGGPNPSCLFYIHDRLSGLRFLVDTGAQVSIIPPSPSERNRCQEHSYLQAMNDTTYGIRSLTLDLGLRRSFRWTFIIANVKQPILGADFLRLLVDIRRHRLSNSLTRLKVQGVLSSLGISCRLKDSHDPYLSLLAEFPAVTLEQPASEAHCHSPYPHIWTACTARTHRRSFASLDTSFNT